MRIIITFLFVLLFMQPVLAQDKPSRTQKPVKNEMQGQMMQAINELNKQITDLEAQITVAKKNKKDEETIKQMEEQLAMLKKQVAMMGGVKKSISGISEKTFEQAGEEEAIVPKKDVARISMLPKKILTEAELILFIKNIHGQVEKIIPAVEKSEAVKIYNKAKSEFKSANALNSAAGSCWMYGHQEKAIWIIGMGCIDYPANPDLLDNYAAFLIMTGAEEAAIPILLYLNNKFPKNSTILNNLGQAWFGLGDIASSKKYLESATELYPTHSMANLTLSSIYLSLPDTLRAIAAIKRSINESYCADKEQFLTGIGGALTLDDLPEFNYPIEKDPYRFESFFQVIPDNQGSVDEYANSDAIWSGFEEAMKEAINQAKMEAGEATKEIAEFVKKMAEDIPYQQSVLYTYHNSPSHALSNRYLLLLAVDEASTNSSSLLHLRKNPYPVSLMFSSGFSISSKKKKPISLSAVWKILNKLTLDEFIKPAEALQTERLKKLKAIRTEDGDEACRQANAINNEFLQKAKSLQSSWKQKIYQKYLELNSPLEQFIAMMGYADKTDILTVAEPDPSEHFIKYYEWHTSLERDIIKSPWIHRQIFDDFLSSYFQLVSYRVTADRCSSTSPKKPPIKVNLPQTKQPECPNKSTINLFGIKIVIEWGRMICDESKLKKLKSGETKGSAVSSAQQSNPTSLEDILGHGPSIERQMNYVSFDEPLIFGNPDADITRRYIEFDKYGNFSDFKIPLNKEGTGFADMNSTETFDQRRWCWIACASGREKKMAGILKK